MQTTYINPTEQSANELFSKPLNQEIVMLNLLRFKEKADYRNTPELAPKDLVSGKQAFQFYIDGTKPILEQSGGKILFLGSCHKFFIGPLDEDWDMVMLVKQHSLATFLSFASNPLIKNISGHREAALEDSRLLPVSDFSLF